MKPARMSPSEAILRTVAGSEFADPVDRAEAELALLVGDYDRHATLESIIAAANRPDDGVPVGRLAGIVQALTRDRRA